MIITVQGGGTLTIDKQLEIWSLMYPNVNVRAEIEKLDETGCFKTKTVNGAAKVINRHLKNLNAKEADSDVQMQQL